MNTQICRFLNSSRASVRTNCTTVARRASAAAAARPALQAASHRQSVCTHVHGAIGGCLWAETSTRSPACPTRHAVPQSRSNGSYSKWKVSSKGGDWARWRRDGREMFYVAADRKVMSVTVQATSGSLEFGTPRALFSIPFALATSRENAPYTYDVAPDGQRILAVVPVGDAATSPMTVILNWQAELSTDQK